MMGVAWRPAIVDADNARAAFLWEALRCFYERSAAEEATLVVSVPALRGDPLALWSSRSNDDAWLWSAPADCLELAGIGVTAELRAVGASRFLEVRNAATAMWRRVEEVSHPACRFRPGAKLFGGFAFGVGAADDDDWSRFGDSRFVLPRWVYTRCGDDACLSLAVVRRGAAPRAREEAVHELVRLMAIIVDGGTSRSGTGWRIRGVEHMPQAVWSRLVNRARDDIESGALLKVVAARRGLIDADAPMDPMRVLARLRLGNPASTTFGMKSGATVFLGATPETLVERRGMVVRTEALAGTARADAGMQLGTILQSGKDRHEHELVVREIVERLRPSCIDLSAPRDPVPHRLGNLVHLRTPIEGTLREREHVLDFVERLHPTPAVGGLPRGEALAWLEAQEPCPRGWYAAPVGWMDAQGDGRFVVALRSGLIRERGAWVYAGAGLVRGSDPAAEYNETGWKLQVMCDALRDAGARESA